MNFIPSAHQAAGHDGCLTSGAVFAKLTTQQEIDFYTEANARLPAEPDFIGSHLAHWMPTFMGTMREGLQNAKGAILWNPEELEDLDPGHDLPEEKPYVVLLNLYHRFVHPCILDIKLGSILTDETVSDAKRARLAAVSRSTTSGLLAFRICGMKVFTQRPLNEPMLFPGMNDTMHSEPVGDMGTYTSFDKMFGRSLDKNNVELAIGLFFKDLPLRNALLTRFHQRLQLFYNCLLDSEVRIKSGSLLFIYEGDVSRWASVDESLYFDVDSLLCDPLNTLNLGTDSDPESDTGSETGSELEPYPSPKNAPLSRMNLIDFAHAKYTDGEGPDDNIIDGVENLIDIFEHLTAAD